ncbi:hypothetical protein [Mycolicibacterium flavescens]|nr:hypothetical protein [Mycolicibacterium flavescens]
MSTSPDDGIDPDADPEMTQNTAIKQYDQAEGDDEEAETGQR